MCEKYEDIFSKDSTDIGRTPLVNMEIDTGDSPPISQRPYNLRLNILIGYKKNEICLKKQELSQEVFRHGLVQ